MRSESIHILLIANESDDVYRTVSRLLSDGGRKFSLYRVGGFSEAAAHAAREATDLILLDQDLADGAGWETLSSLTDRVPDIPIAVITASYNGHIAREAFKHGAQDYLASGEMTAEMFERSALHLIERSHRMRTLDEKDRQDARERERFMIIVNELTVGVMLVDKNGVVVFANPEAQNIMGKKIDGLIGKRFEHSMPKTGTEEIQFTLENGNIRDAEITVSLIDWNNSGMFMLTIRDITEKKRMEEGLKRSERLSSLGSIISGVSHEINNPLTSILGNTQLLLREKHSENILEKLLIIQNQTLRCSKIIAGLTEFARERQPERVYLDINDVINEAYLLKEYELFVDDITVNLALGDELPRLYVDPFQMQQLFINLLNNAHDALLAKNGGMLYIRSYLDSGKIVVDIEDEGVGIQDSIIDKIFEPFFTTKEVGKGVGLGLSTSYGIAHMHDSNLFIESEYGVGTTATLVMDVPTTAGAKDEGPRAVDVHTIQNRDDDRKPDVPSILLVDDEDAVVRVLYESIVSEGYSVDAVNSGEEAIELLKSRKKYAVIITDMKMPGMDGRDLYEHIKLHYPEQLGKIIFITGDILGEDTLNFFSNTGCDFIQKPFDIDTVLKKVAVMLNETRPFPRGID